MAKEQEIDIGMTIVKTIKWGILAIIVLIIVFGGFYTIGPGQRGIITTFGKAEVTSMAPGPHLKIPIVQQITKMDVQTQKYETDASAASKDLQVVSTKIAVNYHIEPDTVPTLFKDIGINYREKIIQPAVQEIVKASTAQFTAEELITKRVLVKEEIDRLLADRLRKSGIIMETTSITNFDFSEQFNAAIEQKVTAEQQALTQKNKLAQVEYEAKQLIATADGTAKSTILNAEAEAKKVQLMQEQLKQSPQYVEYIKVSRWDGKMPQIMLSGTTPLMQLPNLNLTN